MQQVPRDAREAPGRRGGGSGRGREMGGGEMEGGRRPPPRPRGLPHVALVAGLLRVPAGTKEELRRSGACPLPTAPPHTPTPHKERSWGRGGQEPKSTPSGPGWSPPPAAFPPAASPGPLRPGKEAESLCGRLDV